MVLGHYVIKALTAKAQAQTSGSDADIKAADEAEKDANDAADAEDRVAEDNAEVNPEAQEIVPDPGPTPQVRSHMVTKVNIY